LNSSLCCHTTHTQAGHTGAEREDSHHRVLVNWRDYIGIA
jgi:hypothetical protein